MVAIETKPTITVKVKAKPSARLHWPRIMLIGLLFNGVVFISSMFAVVLDWSFRRPITQFTLTALTISVLVYALLFYAMIKQKE